MANPHKSTKIRKLEILEAARLLIIHKGSEHLTVRNIARQIGLTEAAIYRHFRSKRQILLYLSDMLTDLLIGDFREITPDEKITMRTVDRVLRTHMSKIEQRRGVSFQVFAEILSFGDRLLNQRAVKNMNRYIRQLADLLERGLKSRDGARIDPLAAAGVLFGMIHGLVSLWALNSCGFDLLQRYEAGWRVFRRALLVAGEASTPAVVVQRREDDDKDGHRNHAGSTRHPGG